MNHWLKRVAIIAPPLLIAGIYFNVIPVGPGVRMRIDNFMGPKKKTEVKTTQPGIEKIAGEVYMKERPGLDLVAVKGGEVLVKGASLATGENSFALLTSRGNSSWILKVGPNSEINIDELTRDNLIANLIRGELLSVVKNKRISIRTKFASFAATGSTFAIITDGETKAVMTVKEGTVEAEDFKAMVKSLVREGHSYLINRDGEKKVVLDLDSIDLFDWNAENLEAGFPAVESVVEKTGDVGPTLDDKERARQDVLKQIDTAIAEFRSKNEELARELSILKDNADKSREGLRIEIRSVEKDIRCIETSVSECNLMNEKVLLNRGFPRMWGNAKYRHSMVVELQKYLLDRDLEVDGREEEAKVLEDLMKARMTVLKEVETARNSESDLDKLIPRLQDTRLRR